MWFLYSEKNSTTTRKCRVENCWLTEADQIGRTRINLGIIVSFQEHIPRLLFVY